MPSCGFGLLWRLSRRKRPRRKSARFDLLRARRASTCRYVFGDELADKVGDESGPACLVRSTAPAAIVAVEILVEKDVILEIGIGLELFIGPENGTSPVGISEKEPYEAATQLIGDLVESHHHA